MKSEEHRISEHNWRSGKKLNRICENCKNTFVVLAIRVNAGGGKFCSKDCNKNFRKKNKLDKKSRDIIYQKKYKYGLTEEEYKNLTIKYTTCAICSGSFNIGKHKTFHIDHCHVTNKVRGLLCNNCNVGLGLFKDNIDTLLKAIEYLKFHYVS